LIAFVVGIAIAVSGFLFIENLVRQEERSNFRLIADRQVSVIEQLLNRNIETVQSLGGLFDASEQVSRSEFTIFARQHISRVEGIQALSWNPRISSGQLADVKRLARREGMPAYEYYERDAKGEQRKLGPREDYTVVLYIDPFENNQSALGYDVGSNPERLAALNKARDTGQIVATAPIALVQESGKQPAILVFRPVYINGVRPETLAVRRQAIKGYTVGVYRVGDILDVAIRDVGSFQTQIALYDRTDGADANLPLYQSGSSWMVNAQSANSVAGSLFVNKSLDVAGRKWVLNIRPAAPLITRVELLSPWAFLISVLALSVALYGYLVARQSRTIIIETEVAHRTRELAEEVAERKAVEAALLRSERTYAKLTEMAPIGILIYRNRRVENANLGAANLFGASLVDDLIGRARHDFLDPEDVVEAQRRWEMLQAGKPVGVWEVETRRLDGSQFPSLIRTETVDIDGEAYIITVVEDVSVAAKARMALQESEQKYRSLIEFFPEGVLLTEKGIVTQVNSTGMRLHGATADTEIIGRDWITLVDSSFHDLVLGRRNTMEAGDRVEPVELLMKRVDGSTFWGRAQAMPVTIAGNNLFMTVFDDISKRKKAEEEIENANRELVRSNEELAQFAYVASHDLKEPLRMVSSYCDLIAARYADKLDENGQKFIHYATDGAKRMQTLIDDLLLYSRIGRGGEEEVEIELNGVIDDVRDLFSETLREAEAIVNVANLPTVSGYRPELVRLFQNLIGNAIKFRSDIPLIIDVKSEHDDAAWIISVVDNGIGVAPEYRGKIFGVFQRLHSREEYEGTGIGLAIWEKIVSQQLGGRIWQEENPAGGSVFSFSVPDEHAEIE
jgi:PAS domain S-box-containing protein